MLDNLKFDTYQYIGFGVIISISLIQLYQLYVILYQNNKSNDDHFTIL